MAISRPTIGSNYGWTRVIDPSHNTMAASGDLPTADYANFSSPYALASMLQVKYPATYTQRVLEGMTVNDMVFAYRQLGGRF